jgi:hypothetical protein
MPYFLKGNCVWKGTEEDPIEEVKCHADHAAAVAHMKALYANVEDAEKLYVEVEGEWFEFVKGGVGSGWHKPPEGTHTAENAPNFAGGPGKDRTYGTEREEAPEGSKLCKCTECGSVFTLPKGKECKDVPCPGCGGKARQRLARFDSSAGGKNPKGDKKPKGEKKGLEEPCPDCEEEKQETHTCTCPECGKSVQVPLGQKCNEVKCPECSAMMKQGTAGEEKAMDAPGPTVHGEGGSLGEVSSVVGEGERDCKCPECGKRIPCTAKACPYCNATFDKVQRGEGDKVNESEKAEWSAASMNDLPDSSFLYVESGEKDSEGKTTPRSKRHLPYKNASGEVDLPHLRNAISRLGQPATGKGWMSEDLRKRLLSKAQGILKKHGGGEKSIVSYKSADGHWRWMTLSNWAVVDKEAEVVTEQAYRDAIAHAQKSGDWGQLDLVHVNGTDVGDCDTLFVVKCEDGTSKFGGGGTWHDTSKAMRAREAIQADPSAWGVSLKFRFNPARKVQGLYIGDIQVLKHTVLPQAMAASFGTAIAVQGGNMSKQLDEKVVAALADLGHSPEEIEELEEKQKAMPQEENVVEKEDSTSAAPDRETIWKKLGALLFGPDASPTTPVASEPDEARKTDEVTPATTAEPAEKAEGGEDEDAANKALLGVAEAITKAVGDMVKVELEKRDEAIEILQTQVKSLVESVEEKVEQRLRDIPPVVKVAASQVAATAVQEAPKGLTFGRPPEEAEGFAAALVEGIKQVVKDKTEGAGFSV